MIRLFLREHRLWLLFIVVWHVALNMLLLVDVGFEHVSLMYINIVWVVLVLIFLTIRYVREKSPTYAQHANERNYVEAMRALYEQQLMQISQKQKQAELQLLEQQDDVLAWVHDMKSPLTALKLVHEQLVNKAERERAEKEWLRLYLLLDQQLHATRLQSIAEDNRVEQLALQPILIEEIKALRTWCFEKQLAIDFDGTDSTVVSDKKWVSFIVRQLVTNAVKYSKAGGTIVISVTERDERIVVTIADEGVGIASEDIGRVFKKSYTGVIGHETKTATGMGLYLAKQAADVLHIDVAITSQLGQGTTVTMTFPKANAYINTLRM